MKVSRVSANHDAFTTMPDARGTRPLRSAYLISLSCSNRRTDNSNNNNNNNNNGTHTPHISSLLWMSGAAAE